MEAEKRLARDGANTLRPLKQTPELVKFARNLVGGFGLWLWIGSLLALLGFVITLSSTGWIWERTDKSNLIFGVVLIIVILITATFSYLQEYRSTKIMDKFQKMIPQKTLAIREGERRETNVVELVVGDIVCVKGGDKVPADIRILQSRLFS